MSRTSPEAETTTSSTEAYAKLLSLASHEFRTPASVVSGYLRMLQRDPESALSERQRHMIEEAEKSCARMVALLAEMSDLARLEAGTAAMSRAPFDLFALLNELAPSVLESSDRGVHLELRGADSGAALVGDIARTRDAFAAFLRAVLREQPSSCRVAVDRRLMNGRATVAIAHEDDLPQAWPPAGSAPFNEHRGGLGLALPIARRVVEYHGGRVASISSVRPASAAAAAGILVSFDLEQHA